MNPALVEEVHRRAYVADGHADSLMWDRDLNVQSDKGHVDFPRLYESGTRLQCFTLVTRGIPILDGFGLFTWWNNWPKEARKDEWSRALWQIDKLERFCATSAGRAAIAGARLDLESNLQQDRLSALIGVEGAHVVGNDPGRVRQLFDRGVRFMSLTHLDNSEIGGSSFPLRGNRGLTTLGKEVLSEMAKCGMAVDLAHASARCLENIFGGPDVPIFCSHTGIAAVTPSWRNMSDEVLREVKRRNGVVGVIFATSFIGGSRLSNLLDHLVHAVEVMGPEHVGLGSDYDGMIRLPREMRDVRDVKAITGGLLKRGLPPESVELVLGGSYKRFFERVLP
ncbi:MAG: dipeptidase [Myxococcales bacterium]